jgi:hypothetical protein
MIDDIVGWALGGLAILLAVMLIVVLPVTLVTEAKCLERGYPKSAVTWNLKGYCLNLDGSVTVKVDSVEDTTR